ncbi:MAG: SH3 domain-containing protein [Chitinophagaceae bacterium]
MKKQLSGTDVIFLLLAIGLGLYILYHLVIFSAKLFVYLGYNVIFFLENLLEVTPLNPVATWGIFGLILGSIAGVIIAVKKFRLSKLLILYPAGFLLLVVLIMYFVNEPLQHSGTYVSPEEKIRNELVNRGPSKEYYLVYADAKVRKGPSNSKSQLFTLRKGDEVEVLSRGHFDKNNTEWFLIRSNGKEGYASGRLLQFSRTGY